MRQERQKTELRGTEAILMSFDEDERGVKFCSDISIMGFSQINASTLQRVGSIVSKCRLLALNVEHELNQGRGHDRSA